MGKLCFVLVLIIAFLTLMVWQRRRLMNRPPRDDD
jgi:hypothetical protein